MNSIKFFSTLIVLSISCSVLADPPRDIRAYEKKEMLGGSHIQIVVEHKSSKDLTQHFIESVKVVYKDKDTNTEYVLCDETFKKQRNNAGHLFDISNKYDFDYVQLVIHLAYCYL